MIYVDTSVLLALHTRETKTEAVLAWYASLGSSLLVTATWAVTEFASALGIKQRTRQLTARQSALVWSTFGRQCEIELRLLDGDRTAFFEAAALLRADTSGLRAGDALHLAIARRARVESVATLDDAMNRSARTLGIGLAKIAR